MTYDDERSDLYPPPEPVEEGDGVVVATVSPDVSSDPQPAPAEEKPEDNDDRVLKRHGLWMSAGW